jgi:hypothetical protein
MRRGGSGWTGCALVWLEEPAFPGCLVTVRPVAVFVMYDEDGLDAKVLTADDQGSPGPGPGLVNRGPGPRR